MNLSGTAVVHVRFGFNPTDSTLTTSLGISGMSDIPDCVHLHLTSTDISEMTQTTNAM